MGRLKRLSGDDVIRILERAGFVVLGQKGSHVKLRRIHQATSQTMTVPRHRELDPGALRAIVRQAQRFLPEAWLTKHFFSD